MGPPSSPRHPATPAATERISSQIATFDYKRSLVGFAAFKTHRGFYVMSPPVMAAHNDELASYDTVKATVGFQSDKPLPAALVTKLVRARIQENERAR